MRAQCQCGQLTATIALPGDTEPDAGAPSIVACHCLACQRRSGSPFGVIAYFPASAVEITGEVREFARPADSGAPFTTGFCPTCGTTIWARTDRHPEALGIPVGTFADPAFAAPHRSVWEATRHGWVQFPDGTGHFQHGRVAPSHTSAS